MNNMQEQLNFYASGARVQHVRPERQRKDREGRRINSPVLPRSSSLEKTAGPAEGDWGGFFLCVCGCRWHLYKILLCEARRSLLHARNSALEDAALRGQFHYLPALLGPRCTPAGKPSERSATQLWQEEVVFGIVPCTSCYSAPFLCRCRCLIRVSLMACRFLAMACSVVSIRGFTENSSQQSPFSVKRTRGCHALSQVRPREHGCSIHSNGATRLHLRRDFLLLARIWRQLHEFHRDFVHRRVS
jgi:hypothetical protein